jgi:hypothetical protein
MLSANVPLALADGVRAEAIEAFVAGRIDDLNDTERQYVQFVRLVLSGEMTDEVWAKQVEIVGSERGVVEALLLCLLEHTYIRIAQSLGVEPDTDAGGLSEMIKAFMENTAPSGDFEGYDAYFRSYPWPDTPHV